MYTVDSYLNARNYNTRKIAKNTYNEFQNIAFYFLEICKQQKTIIKFGIRDFSFSQYIQ